MATQFTTREQVERRLSATGVALRIDHAPSTAFDEANNAASLYVLGFLGGRYPASVLDLSEWVASVTADVCIWYLDQFRNNPVGGSIDARKEMWDKQLEMIQQGKMPVPDVPNAVDRPEVIGQRVNPRDYPAVRTTRDGSTDYQPTGYPRYPDRTEPRTMR